MSMIDFPKIDSQGFFHDWNGFAMDRFNDPHLPSAGFTRRGVSEVPRVRATSSSLQLEAEGWLRRPAEARQALLQPPTDELAGLDAVQR